MGDFGENIEQLSIVMLIILVIWIQILLINIIICINSAYQSAYLEFGSLFQQL